MLALLVVEQRTGSVLLGGLAFSIGFIALLLAHSELFTEGFLVPVIAVVAGRTRFGALLRLWVVTLVGNLIAGWAITWILAVAFPSLRHEAMTSAAHFLDAGIGGRSIALGLLAGASMTLMTRMQHGTDSMPARVAAVVAMGFVLAGLRLSHSILDSLLIFTALHEGRNPFGYLDWLGWASWSALWNLVGGLGLITMLRLVRSKERIRQEQEGAERAPSGDAG